MKLVQLGVDEGIYPFDYRLKFVTYMCVTYIPYEFPNTNVHRDLIFGAEGMIAYYRRMGVKATQKIFVDKLSAFIKVYAPSEEALLCAEFEFQKARDALIMYSRDMR